MQTVLARRNEICSASQNTGDFLNDAEYLIIRSIKPAPLSGMSSSGVQDWKMNRRNQF